MRAVLVAAALLLVLAAAVLALGWVLSSRVVVPAPYSLMPEFEVVASDPGPPVTVTLPRTDSGRQHADVDANGTYALVWDGGYGLLGEAVADAGGAVTRRLDVVEGELPAAGAPARIDNFVYRRDPLRDHGLAFEDLTLRGPVGNVRAWYVPPAPERSRSRSGALVLHGRRRGELIETLRFVPLLHDLGLHVLAQSYRNHDASDPSPDGLYHYGASEWEDALAGARELRRRGVDRVVLFGISMGGAIALEALERWGGDLPEVVGVVLDSPLVDPYAAIELGAAKAGLPLPGPLTRLALAVAGWRTGVDFGSLVQAESADRVPVPVMVVAGTADTTVPVESVDRFVSALRVPVTYHRLEGVEHVDAWNRVGAERYGEWLRAFVASLEVRAASR